MSELRSGLDAPPGDQLLAGLGLNPDDLAELRRPPPALPVPPGSPGAPLAAVGNAPPDGAQPIPSHAETLASPEMQEWLNEKPTAAAQPAAAGATTDAAPPGKTVVPPIPPGFVPVYDPLAVEQHAARMNALNMPSVEAEAVAARLREGDNLYRNPQTGETRWLPTPGGVKDTGSAIASGTAGATTGAQATAQDPHTLETHDEMQPDGSIRPVTRTRQDWITRSQAPQGQPAVPGGGPASGALVGPPQLTPEQAKISQGYGDIAAGNMAAATAAPTILGKVQDLRAAGQVFNQGPMGGMGPSAADRLNMANRLVDIGNQFGFQVPQALKDTVAAGQIIGKEQGQLTAQIVRQLGSGEAQSIYGATQDYTPGVTMSQGGFNAIVNSIEQGARRDLDKAKFQDQWLGSHSSIAGMGAAFEKANPIETYSSKVVPIPMSYAKGNYVPGAIYSNPKGVRATRMPDGSFQPVQ
ncbi:MAG TPA: hypothetical protein VGF39_03930 [Stellaceae bacterium]|jgi:hypothetical protein